MKRCGGVPFRAPLRQKQRIKLIRKIFIRKISLEKYSANDALKGRDVRVVTRT